MIHAPVNREGRFLTHFVETVSSPSRERVLGEYRRRPRTDMRGAWAASSKEGGSWGKHGFPHEASAPEAREAS
jgi:hypothetical protein